MADLFMLHIKSTIDKMVADRVAELTATYPTLRWAEVDDMAQTDEVFKSDEPGLIWQFDTLEPHPKAPMYRVEFMVGAKTTQDAGNYLLFNLLGEAQALFPAELTFQVRDYSALATDPAASVDKGYLMISSNEVAPQQFDRQSGIRYARVVAKGVSYG